MFKTIANILSAREAPAPRFMPPENKHTESVPEFRAHLREIGLTESEASAVMVARAVAGMSYLTSKGYTWEQILDMPASRYLAMPTSESDYGDYCRIARVSRERAKLGVTCGLN